MQNSAETGYCSNCKKPFQLDRIDLHEAYCIRNIKQCNQCGSFIDKNEIEAHQRQFHQKKLCNYCKQQFSTNQLTIHIGVCERRPKQCRYCETNVASSEFNSHQTVCGARTRVCTICSQPVMLKDYVTHEIRCRQQPPVLHQVPRPVVPNINVSSTNNLPPNRRNPYQRERDISANGGRHIHQGGGGERSLSTKKQGQRYGPRNSHKTKYHQIIPQQKTKPMIDILPISVQISLNQAKRDNRQPLRSKNAIV